MPELSLVKGAKCSTAFFPNILHGREFECSMISVSTFDSKRFHTTVMDGQCRLAKAEKLGASNALGHSQCVMSFYGTKHVGVASLTSFRIWNERLEHDNENGVFNMARNGISRGVSQLSNNDVLVSQICIVGKRTSLQKLDSAAQKEHSNGLIRPIQKTGLLFKCLSLVKQEIFPHSSMTTPAGLLFFQSG